MARKNDEQLTASRPLNDESEEEKRKRAAAQDYLEKRDRFTQAQKSGVDMTDLDISGMSDEQIKAEGNRRLGAIKSDFENSYLAANKAGFSNMQAAQDYLNKGQARIVGDTLVGSAAGISASEWDKAESDPSVLAGNPSMQKKDMVEIAPGVKADYDTAKRTTANMRAQAERDKAALPDYEKARAALDRIAKTRDETAAKNQKEGVARWNQWRLDRENDRMIAQKTQRERSAANREYADANRNRSTLLKAQREGKVLDPDLLQKANERLVQADRGRRYGGLDSEQQSYLFEDMIRDREGIPLRNPGLRRRRFNPYSITTGSTTTSRTPGGMGA